MDIKRVAAVTGGLVVAGMIAGAVVGAAIMQGWFFAWGLGFAGEILVGGGMLGAASGAVLGPLSAWTMMRHVPLGRAIGGTALGTMIGAAVGFFAPTPHVSMMFGLFGFVVAAVVLLGSTPRDSDRGRVAVPRDPST